MHDTICVSFYALRHVSERWEATGKHEGRANNNSCDYTCYCITRVIFYPLLKDQSPINRLIIPPTTTSLESSGIPAFKVLRRNSLWRWCTGSAGTWSLVRCGWMGLGTWAGLGGRGIPFKCSLSPLTSGADNKKETSVVCMSKMKYQKAKHVLCCTPGQRQQFVNHLLNWLLHSQGQSHAFL